VDQQDLMAVLNWLNDGNPNSQGLDSAETESSGLNPNDPTPDASGINPKLVAKPVYPALERHQRTEAEWKHHERAVVFHEWWDRFDQEFGLQLPHTPVRVEETLRQNCLGYFHPGHNEFGLRMEIAIAQNGSEGDRWQLDRGDMLGTLLHEMLHLYQELNGKAGKNNYHNKEYREKALGVGLIVDDRGHQDYAAESAFLDLLRRHGIPLPRLWLVSRGLVPVGGNPSPKPNGPRGGKSKLKLWMCACGIRARVAVPHFRAVCLHCNGPFVLKT